MRLATRTAAIAGGLLAALLGAGCGAHASSGSAAGAATATAAGSESPATAQGCTDYGVYAIEHRITVTTTPAACRGLSKADVSQAAAVAILRVAGGERKAVWRKRAAEVAPYLAHLITVPPPVTASVPASAGLPGASGPAARRFGGQDLGMDTAALIAWLVTAASGAYVLGSWLSGGGSLRRRASPASSTASPPSVVVGHFGLALAGLALWIIYLAVGWAALAWTAVCLLLPVAGLGMAVVTIGLPGRAPVPPAPGTPGEDDQKIGGGTAVLSVRLRSVREQREVGAPSAWSRLSPLVVVVHGLLAVTTMTLVLLAAIGAPAG